MIKLLTFFAFLLFSSQPEVPSPIPYVDPTGTYIIKGTLRNGQITGYFGEIRVKLIDSSSIAVAFYVNNGYPLYRSGAFIDTIAYAENQAIYAAAPDSSCEVILKFSRTGVDLSQYYSDPHSTCGFSAGVSAVGFIRKSSSRPPIIRDLSRDGTQ